MTAGEKTIGIIGGMGPEATVEFMRRLVAAVPAKDDADHLHVIADNNSKVPSRIKALIEGGGEDPAPVLIGMARGLEAAGAQILAIPCNTAHYYLPRIAQAVNVPVLDVVALTVDRLVALSPKPHRIGMLASPAVRRVGLFESRLAAAGFETLFPAPQDEARLLGIIRAVKSGDVSPAQWQTYQDIASTLASRGADAFLVACTELSLMLAPRLAQPVLDTLDILVDATVAAARG